MAFSDLITKDIAAPLGGFDKAVATGFELAQNQEKIGLAQQQNQLEQEKLQASYLDKANNLLPNLLKTSGKARKILTTSYMNLMAKGGLSVDQDTMDLISSDDELGADVESLVKQGKILYPNDPVGFAAFLSKGLGLPPGDAMSQITGVMKGQLSAQAAAQRAVYQQGQVAARQKTQFETKAFADVSNELNKRSGDTQKEVDSLIKNTAAVEASLKQNSLSNFYKTLGQQAKTAGTVGALSDFETKLQAPAGLKVKVAELKRFVSGDAPIPELVKEQVQKQIDSYKNTAADLVTSRNIGAISDRSSDPRSGAAYLVKQDQSGNLQLGFASARLIDSSNRTLRSLKKDDGILDLNAYLKKQSVPMSSEQILSLIKDAASGNLLDKKTNKPTGKRLIIKFSPESVIKFSPVGSIGVGESYSETPDQSEADMEGSE